MDELMVAAAAHDQAVNRSGKTITPADVLKAVSELDFGPADVLIPLLERELAGGFGLIA
jgi:DNA polymerase epsilon subunit 3